MFDACCRNAFTGIQVAPFASLDLLLRTNPSADTTITVCIRAVGDVELLDALAQSGKNGVQLQPDLDTTRAAIKGELNKSEPKPGYDLKPEQITRIQLTMAKKS